MLQFRQELNMKRFPKYPELKISIVLVLHNKAELSLACLQAIYDYADVPYELVIVDNASTDDTPLLLSQLRDVKIHTCQDYVGFSETRNLAVQRADGEWVLFINPDVQMGPKVLSSLLHIGETIPSCGAVGGKLVGHDGQLRDAGGMIWQDGSCTGYGMGDDPNKPEYSYVREIYYAAGACLLVRKDVFLKAGMLEEREDPAYDEEADLSMRIRKLGFKIMFQPFAVAYQLECDSPSTWEAENKRPHNRERFRDKWKHVLAHYPVFDEENAICAREFNRRKLRILVIDDRVPVPELGTGYPRAFTIVSCLAELDFQVSFYPLLNPEPAQPCTRTLQQHGIEVLYARWGERLDFPSFYEERKLLYDAVLISRPHNMKQVIASILSANPKQKIVYDAEGLFSLRDIRHLELFGYKMSEQVRNGMLEEEVVHLMGAADIVISVSESERQIIQRYMAKPVVVLGHMVEIRTTSKPFVERRDILFVGGFLSPLSPNEDAMYDFVEHIFPKVREQLDAKLWIVGTNQSERVWKLASRHVIVTGRVDRLWDYYNNCKIFVVPTRFESGIPLKVFECLSHGLPAVVTPLIAAQLNLDEETALIGTDADDFANKVVKAYTDAEVWHKLRDNSYKYIQVHCKQEAYKDKLRKLRQIIYKLKKGGE